MIGIIIAMDKELFPYLSGNSYVKKEIGGKEFFEFNINGKEAVEVKSGIGKVNSAYATTLLINNYNPEFIISTGISFLKLCGQNIKKRKKNVKKEKN